jgi:hypothetical protein
MRIRMRERGKLREEVILKFSLDVGVVQYGS